MLITLPARKHTQQNKQPIILHYIKEELLQKAAKKEISLTEAKKLLMQTEEAIEALLTTVRYLYEGQKDFIQYITNKNILNHTKTEIITIIDIYLKTTTLEKNTIIEQAKKEARILESIKNEIIKSITDVTNIEIRSDGKPVIKNNFIIKIMLSIPQ